MGARLIIANIASPVRGRLPHRWEALPDRRSSWARLRCAGLLVEAGKVCSSVVGLVMTAAVRSGGRLRAGCRPPAVLPRHALLHAASCPGADASGGTAEQRTAAVLCVASQARARAHRIALRGASALQRSAALKVDAIERCNAFTHTPCGSPMARAMQRTGYARGCYSVGENLAWVTPGVTPREVVKAWLASPAHRANLLDRRFRDTGVAGRVVTLGRGRPGGAVGPALRRPLLART